MFSRSLAVFSRPVTVLCRRQDVHISNCSFLGNVGGGVMMGLHKLSDFGVPPAHPTQIEIENCTIEGAGTVTYHSGHHGHTLSRGNIAIKLRNDSIEFIDRGLQL